MNIKRMVQIGMTVAGVGLVFLVISLDEPTIQAWVLAIVGALLLALAPEVE